MRKEGALKEVYAGRHAHTHSHKQTFGCMHWTFFPLKLLHKRNRVFVLFGRFKMRNHSSNNVSISFRFISRVAFFLQCTEYIIYWFHYIYLFLFTIFLQSGEKKKHKNSTWFLNVFSLNTFHYCWENCDDSCQEQQHIITMQPSLLYALHTIYLLLMYH